MNRKYFKDFPELSLNGVTIDKDVAEANMFPRGSAVISSSGKLAKQGISNIIHAESGSMRRKGEKFIPSLSGVINSIKNSINLAIIFDSDGIAIPFVGGKLFIDRIGMSKSELADAIVKATVNEIFKKDYNDLKVVLVTFSNYETDIFDKSLKQHLSKFKNKMNISVVQGDITNFKVHECESVVNAGNMEGTFGGKGISKSLGDATKQAKSIQKEIQEIRDDFNDVILNS